MTKFSSNCYYSTKNIEAIIFDLSGTLIDDFQAVFRSLLGIFELYDLPALTHQEFRREFKLPYRDFLAGKGFANIQLVIQQWRDRYALYEDSISLFEDVKPVLETFRKLNIKQGVVSQTPEELLKRNLTRFGISDFFDECVLSDEWKPAPNGLVLAMKRLNINWPNKVLYVGDMKEDCQAARRAGITPLAIYRENGSFHDLETLIQGQPVRIVRSLTELVPLVQPIDMSDTPLKVGI